MTINRRTTTSTYLTHQTGRLLVLTQKIGSGNDRDCWRHPVVPEWCVKVARPEQLRPQNEIEFHYGRFLAQRGVYGPHIPRIHGWAHTHLGRGLVVDLIQQPDASPAPTLGEALSQGLITTHQAVRLVQEAFGWLVQHDVILSDYSVSNMLACRASNQRWRLVFVDGLGARHFGLNYWINRNLGFKARQKARKYEQRTLAFVQQHAATRELA